VQNDAKPCGGGGDLPPPPKKKTQKLWHLFENMQRSQVVFRRIMRTCGILKLGFLKKIQDISRTAE
jgi:hypothetical protein